MPDDETPTPWYKLHLWEIQVVRDVLLIVGGLLALWLGHALSFITIPLLIGLGLAYLFEPVIGRLQQWSPRLTRGRLVVASLVLLCLAVLGILAAAIPPVVSQSIRFVKNADDYGERVLAFSQQSWVPEDVRTQVRDVIGSLGGEGLLARVDEEQRKVEGVSPPEDDDTESSITDLPDDAEPAPPATVPADQSDSPTPPEPSLESLVAAEVARQRVDDGPSPIGKLVRGGVGVLEALIAVFGTLTSLGLSLFLMLFFFASCSLSFPRVVARIDSWIPPLHKERAHHLLGQMDRAVSGFVRGRLLIAGILAIAFAVSWSFLQVPYAVMLGASFLVLAIVPYAAGLGLVLAWLLLVVDLVGTTEPSLYRTADGALIWWRIFVLPAIPFFVIQTIDDYWLTPTIQGKATNLGFGSILVALLIGGAVAGLYGMLLAIPVAACLRILLIEVVTPRLRAWIRGDLPDPIAAAPADAVPADPGPGLAPSQGDAESAEGRRGEDSQ